VSAFLFYLFGAIAIAGALGMVANVRNTVAGAVSLVATMIALGAIYVLLEAYLIGVLQILVYAGAIVVVFLFVVMLLNLRQEEYGPSRIPGAKVWAALITGLVLVQFLRLLPGSFGRAAETPPGFGGYRAALHGLRAGLRGDLAPAAGGDAGRRGAGEAEDRLMVVPVDHVIALSAILFAIGVVGTITRRNLIVILMSIEVMLNAVNLALVGFSRQWADVAGQVFVLMVIVVAAAEVAVGLGIVIAIFRNRESVNVEDASLLRW
jgi:NADH-quinone oxidoreductase subunit K